MKKASYFIIIGLFMGLFSSYSVARSESKKSAPPAPSARFAKESYLTNEIKASGLNTVLPEELKPECNKVDKTKVWTELMMGLSYVESKWNTHSHTPNDHKNTPSTGLYQMTGADVFYQTKEDKKSLKNGNKCFRSQQETRNEEKNIHCAVWKMKELMNDGTSLKKNASFYWGPFKPYQYKKAGKGGALVEFVKEACRKGTLNNTFDHWARIEEYTPYSLAPRYPPKTIIVETPQEKKGSPAGARFFRGHR